MLRFIHDETLSAPKGFSHGVLARGTSTLFIAGQIALDRNDHVIAVGDMVGQFEAAITNFSKVLKAGGVAPNQVTKITIFVTDMPQYLKNARRIGELYREVFGKHYPAMTMVQVDRLVREECLIEIEGIAVV